MKIGFVFHKDPCAPRAGIDIIRLGALTEGLRKLGFHVDIIAPVEKQSETAGGVPVYPVGHLESGASYDCLKTCYHFSTEWVRDFRGPIVSRIVRVVDERLPERDAAWRTRLLESQEWIRRRASVIVLNNQENALRWHEFYGKPASIELIPTGCPSLLPPEGRNPYDGDEPVVLFLGSLASARMVAMLNDLAVRLASTARLHHIGRMKPHLYGSGQAWDLSPLIVRHGEMREEDIWDYVRHAGVGLAIAPGPHAFDNDLSKVYSYLRGGLPVLSEERIVNNELVRATGWGAVFRYGDVKDAAAKAARLMAMRARGGEGPVMSHMACHHAWENRVDQYAALFRRLQAGAQRSGPY